jgi:hypothetical protein
LNVPLVFSVWFVMISKTHIRPPTTS